MVRAHIPYVGVYLHSVFTRTGDIVYLDMLGRPMVVLGSHKVARELMDKRSGNYSNRPPSVMAKLYVLSERALVESQDAHVSSQDRPRLCVRVARLWRSMVPPPAILPSILQRRRRPTVPARPDGIVAAAPIVRSPITSRIVDADQVVSCLSITSQL